jgi:hypothetical protein
LDQYLHFGPDFNGVNWRTPKASFAFELVEDLVDRSVKSLW